MSTTIEPQEVAPTRARTDVGQRNGRRATPAADAAGRSSFWRAEAAAELLRGGLDGDAAWKLYWKRRQPRASLAQLCDSPAPLAWSASADNLPAAWSAVFNLAGETVISLKDLAALLIEIGGQGRVAIRPFPDDRRRIDIGDYYADASLIRRVLKWEPRVPLREGLRRTVSFYREHLEHYL